jgi:multimeric flavodoxin WrbA
MTPIRALVLNCTLKRSPAPSNSFALAKVLGDALVRAGAACEYVRVADYVVHPGVSSDEGDGDEWPAIREQIVVCDILVVASPIWVGQPSSVAKRAIERTSALMSEQDAAGRPLAYGKVAGFVVVGHEDGAHHVIAELAQAAIDIGFTVPAQAWTYWHLGPGTGPDYIDDQRGHDWSDQQARTAAANLLAVAEALRAHPLPAPDEG